jgi:hypothetical protein
MPLILGTNSIKDTGYDVANSVRLNAGDNPSGSVTQGTPTNVDKYTFSVWVKRADIGASNSKIFSVSSGSTYGEEKLEFNNDDVIWRQTEPSEGNTNWERVTDRKFRDASAWYNIIVAYDSSQGTAADRCKMYINGVQETSFSSSSNPSSGQDSYTNTSGRALKFFALHENVNSQNAGAYFAEMVYVDGQQLDQTSFGEFDSDSPNIWKPIDVSGLTFGNNGFYLDFEDSSALGNDVSGNNNDVTFSNIASTDQTTDTCTNNFATLNPLATIASDPTYAEGNLQITGNNDWGATPSTISTSTSGKYYAECKIVAQASAFGQFGIFVTDSWTSHTLGYTHTSTHSIVWTIDYRSGQSKIEGTGTDVVFVQTPTSFSDGDIIGMAVDVDNGKLYFHRNGTYVTYNSGTQNPSSGSNGITLPSSTSGYYIIGNVYPNTKLSLNFGSPAFSISSGNSDGNGYGNFEYAVPSGHYALNTKNLAEFG